jgi:hypothetical protein
LRVKDRDFEAVSAVERLSEGVSTQAVNEYNVVFEVFLIFSEYTCMARSFNERDLI